MDINVESRDWTNVPLELLHLISKQQLDALAFIRFRAVCKSWRSSVPLSNPPQQLPWLLEVVKIDSSLNEFPEELRFHTISSGETGTLRIKLPVTCRYSNFFKGPSCGSLFFDHRHCLFNPVTNRSSFKLSTYPIHNPTFLWTGKDPMYSDQFPMFCDRYGRQSSFWKSCFSAERSSANRYLTSCYSGGMVFSSVQGYSTEVWDASRRGLLYSERIDPPVGEKVRRYSKIYLVESAGKVLRVRMNLCRPKLISIYQLDFDRGNKDHLWVKVHSIGDQILFLDEFNGFSVSAIPFAGFRGNCIYFFGTNLKPYKYDIKDDTVEKLRCPFRKSIWFIPNLQ